MEGALCVCGEGVREDLIDGMRGVVMEERIFDGRDGDGEGWCGVVGMRGVDDTFFFEQVTGIIGRAP